MKNTETLEKLCEIVERQIDKCVDALEREGGKLPMEDAKYLDLLTHTQKSIKTTLAMEGYGHSERRGRDSMGRYTSRDGGSYDDGRSERGYAYDDGGSYRYGRSMHGEDMRDKLRRMADETGDEKVKRALLRAASDM